MVVKDRNNHLRSHKTGARTEMPFMLGKNIGRYGSHYEYYTTYKELEIIGGTKNLAKHIAIPRVLIRRTGNSVCATYSDTPELIESTLYIMTGETEKDLKSALAILNSKLMTYYVRQSFVTNQQAFPQIVMSNLERLPLATLSAQQKGRLASLVSKVLTVKRADPRADTSTLEGEINQLVYQLYGLTEEDIAIVEGKA
jgi:adenine-specific DNA-methyltransferase